MTAKVEIPSDLNMLSVRALHGIADELKVAVDKKKDNKEAVIEKVRPAIEQAIADGVYLREQPQGGSSDASNQAPGAGGDATSAADGSQTDAGQTDGQQAGSQDQTQGQAGDGTQGQGETQPVAAGEPQKALATSKYAAIAELLDAGRKVDGYEYVRQVKVAKNLTVTPTDLTKTDPVTGEVWVLCQIKEKHLNATR